MGPGSLVVVVYFWVVVCTAVVGAAVVGAALEVGAAVVGVGVVGGFLVVDVVVGFRASIQIITTYKLFR